MKAPPYAVLSLAFEPAKYALLAPRDRERITGYYLDQLLAGQEIAASELEHYGIRPSVRMAFKKEVVG
jgi:hypothetical protein